MQNAKCKVIFIIALLTFSFALFTYVHPALAQTAANNCTTAGTSVANGLVSAPDLGNNLINKSGGCVKYNIKMDIVIK